MRKVLPALLTAAALLGAQSASATTATNTFLVSATVLKTCTVTGTALTFPAYSAGTGAQTASSTVAVLCTSGATFTVALNGGTTTGGTISQRLLAETAGAGTLQYNLYTSNAYTTLWGDGTTGSTQSGTGAGLATAQNFTVYGKLVDSAVNQAQPAGAYTDTIQVTVTY